MRPLARHYTIRKATVDDTPQLVECWQLIDREGEPRPFGGDTADKSKHAERTIEQVLESRHAQLLVCTVDQQVVGTISCHIFDKPAVRLNPVGVIYSLWVDEAHRKQGIAKHLLANTETFLKNSGVQSIQVGWDSPNQLAAHWWQARGYKPYEVIASKNISS